MCKFCERVDSVIEAMENLYTLEDWKVILLESELIENDSEMNDIILHDDRNVWMNIIALIAATWSLKKNIPLFPASMTMAQHMGHIYAYRTAHQPFNHDKPDNPDQPNQGKQQS